MDVYVHVDGVTKVDAYSQFNWELWNFGRAIATEKDAEKDVAVARLFRGMYVTCNNFIDKIEKICYL